MDVLIDRAWSDFATLKGVSCDAPAHGACEFLCVFCGGPKVFDGVEIDLPVCRDCGRVDEAYICEEPEWRSGGDGEGGADPSRVGAPTNTDHFSAAWGQTTYMTVNRAASYATKRLARINMHASMNHRDRALFHAYAEMDRIGKGILKLTDAVMYSAKIKYKAFNEAVLTRGAVRNGIKANCVFLACREAGIPESERGRIRMKIVSKCKSLEDKVELMGRTPKAIACAVMASVLKDVPGAPSRAELCKICDISVPTLSKIEALLNS